MEREADNLEDRENSVETEIQKHEARAARFGTELVVPKPQGASGRASRSVRSRDGFKTGIDLYNAEEQAKRESRAARFATCSSADQTYRPLVDDNEGKKRERAARFGMAFNAVDHSGQQNEDLQEERKDHGALVERRVDTIYLYGVDRMSTDECLRYFEDYGPSSVEWLDDSSCNVVFGDADSAKRAVVGKGRPFGPGEAPDLQGLDLHDMDNLPYMWHKGEDYQKGSRGSKPFSVPLIFRIATVEDRKGVTPAKRSRYLWMKRASRRAGQPGKRTRGAVDGEDIVMSSDMRQRKRRGGRTARRQSKKGPNGAEIEMEDAEDFQETPAVVVVSATISDDAQAQRPDLRGQLSNRQNEDLDSEQFRMFSAQAAGLEPLPRDGKVVMDGPEMVAMNA